MRLLVVAGHGAGDSGAVGSGYQEQERVRTLAKRMKALGGSSVVLGDINKNWYASNGFQSVNTSTFDCAIELHLDSAGTGARGGHVIIKGGLGADKYDKALASFLKGYFPGRSVIISERHDLQNVNVCASRGINYRLVECCFISDSTDMKKFNANIDTIAKAFLASFGINAKGKPKQPASDPKNDVGLTYHGHVQTVGDLPTVRDGQIAGSVGYAARLEALIFDAIPEGYELRIRVHIQRQGWTKWETVKIGKYYGTKGKSLRLEAIELKATKDGKEVDIFYQMHVQSKGWMKVVKNGATAGTTGDALRGEAAKIWLAEAA